jgi:hypothetical protein
MELTNLIPATHYNVFCATKVAQTGRKMAYQDMIDQSISHVGNVSTLCCRSITVALMSDAVSTDYDNNRALIVDVDTVPELNLTMTLTVTSDTDDSEAQLLGTTSLQWLPYSPLTSLRVAIGSHALGSAASGRYTLNVVLGGESAPAYSVTYPRGAAIQLVAAGAEPDTPRLTSAQFSESGRSLFVMFSKQTDRARKRGSFTCSKLMTFDGSDDSVCTWRDSRTLFVALPGLNGGSARPSVSSLLIVRDSRLKAKCSATIASSCSSWGYSVNSSINPLFTHIKAPERPIVPVVVVNVPDRVGQCDQVPLDLRASTGHAGSDWTSISFDVTSTNGTDDNCLSMIDWLSDNVVTTTKRILLPRWLYNPGVKYALSVRLCNIFGRCGSMETEFIVLLYVKPSVYVPGSAVRKLYRTESLVLWAEGETVACPELFDRGLDYGESDDISINTANLEFSWSMSRTSDGADVTALVATGGDYDKDGELIVVSTPMGLLRQRFAAYLEAYSLEVGQDYTLTVSVYSSAYASTNTYSVLIQVVDSPLKAVISGAKSRAIEPAGSSIVLDGSGSHDPDSTYFRSTSFDWVAHAADGGNVTTKEDMLYNITFSWTCETVYPVITDDCDSLLSFNATSDWGVSVSALAGSGDTVSKVTLTIQDWYMPPTHTEFPTSQPTSYPTTEATDPNATAYPTPLPVPTPLFMPIPDLRSASAVVYVRGVPPGEPLVEVSRITPELGDVAGAEEDEFEIEEEEVEPTTGSVARIDGEKKVVFKATLTAPINTAARGGESSVRGSVSWTVNGDSDLDLSVVSASELTRSIKMMGLGDASPSSALSSSVLYLVLKEGSLSSHREYTFTLTYTSTDATVVTSAGSSVTVNSAPDHGTILVSPEFGHELNTSFTLSLAAWEDSDLPLSYEPFLIDPSAPMDDSADVATATRSEDMEYAMVLPAGRANASTSIASGGTYSSGQVNTSLTVGAYVYDYYGAKTRTLFTVTVEARGLPSLEVETYLNDALDSASSAGEAKLAVVVTSIKANAVNCDQAPNCTVLHRRECSNVAHTCGACIADFFSSTTGSGNSMCVAKATSTSASVSATSAAAAAATSGSDDDYYVDDDAIYGGSRRHRYQRRLQTNVDTVECSSDSDCTVTAFHLCNTTDGTCYRTSQDCSADCSGRGDCSFSDVRTSAPVDTCLVGDPTCEPVCVCGFDSYGPVCAMTGTEMWDARNLRLRVLQGLEYVVEAEDATASNVQGWVALLTTLSHHSFELSPTSTAIVRNITEGLLELDTEALGVDVSGLWPLLAVADSVCRVREEGEVMWTATSNPTSMPTGFLLNPSFGGRRTSTTSTNYSIVPPGRGEQRQYQRRHLVDLDNTTYANATNSLAAKRLVHTVAARLADLTIASMLPDEEPVTSVNTNFRLYAAKIARYSSVNGTFDGPNGTFIGNANDTLASAAAVYSNGTDVIVMTLPVSDAESELSIEAPSLALLALDATSGLAGNATAAVSIVVVATASSMVDTSFSTESAAGTFYPTSQPTTFGSLNRTDNTSLAKADFILMYNHTNTPDFGVPYLSYANLTSGLTAASSSVKVSLSCSANGASMQSQRLLVVMPHDSQQDLYSDSYTSITRLNYTTECVRKHPSWHHYYCPDSQESISVYCDGRRETKVSFCPQVQRASACALVDVETGGVSHPSNDAYGDAGGAAASANTGYNCTKIDSLSNATQTTCECTLCSASTDDDVDVRRLSSGTATAEELAEIEVVAVTYYTLGDALATLDIDGPSSSSEDIDAGIYMALLAQAALWLLLPLTTVLMRKFTAIQENDSTSPNLFASDSKGGSAGDINKIHDESTLMTVRRLGKLDSIGAGQTPTRKDRDRDRDKMRGKSGRSKSPSRYGSSSNANKNAKGAAASLSAMLAGLQESVRQLGGISGGSASQRALEQQAERLRKRGEALHYNNGSGGYDEKGSPHRGGGGLDRREGRDVVERASLYVSSLLPALFRTNRPGAPEGSSVLRELSDHHPFLAALCEMEGSRALVRLAHVLTLCCTCLYVAATLLALQVPNHDDLLMMCSPHDDSSEADCLSHPSPFDPALNQCSWDAFYRECRGNTFLSEDSLENTRVYAAILLWAGVISIPVHIVLDFVFARLLLAPTTAETARQDTNAFLKAAAALTTATPFGGEKGEGENGDNDKPIGPELSPGAKARAVARKQELHAARLDVAKEAARRLNLSRGLHGAAATATATVAGNKHEAVDLEAALVPTQPIPQQQQMVLLEQQPPSHIAGVSVEARSLQVACLRAVRGSVLARAQIGATTRLYRYRVDGGESTANTTTTSAGTAAAAGRARRDRGGGRVPPAPRSEASSQLSGSMIHIGEDSGDAAANSINSDRTASILQPPSDVTEALYAPQPGPLRLDLESGDDESEVSSSSMSSMTSMSSRAQSLRPLEVTGGVSVFPSPPRLSMSQRIGSFAGGILGAGGKGWQQTRSPLANPVFKGGKESEDLRDQAETVRLMAQLRSLQHISKKSRSLADFQRTKNAVAELNAMQRKRFHRAIIGYRNTLPTRRAIGRLDSAWTLSLAKAMQRNEGPGGFHFEALADREMARHGETVCVESARHIYRLSGMPQHLRGPEVLRMFFLDLLGTDTVAAKVLHNKIYGGPDADLPILSNAAKTVIVIVLCIANGIMAKETLLTASLRNAYWQEAWAHLALAMVALLLGIVMSTEAAILQYWLPRLAAPRITDMRMHVMRILARLLSEPVSPDNNNGSESSEAPNFKYHPETGKKLSRRRRALMLEEWQQEHDRQRKKLRKRAKFTRGALDGKFIFSATDYFFVSTHLARALLLSANNDKLLCSRQDDGAGSADNAADNALAAGAGLEAALVLSYRDPHPGPMKWRWLSEAQADRDYYFTHGPGRGRLSQQMEQDHEKNHSRHHNHHHRHHWKLALVEEDLAMVEHRHLNEEDIFSIATQRLTTKWGGRDQRTAKARAYLQQQLFRLRMSRRLSRIAHIITSNLLAFAALPLQVQQVCMRIAQPAVLIAFALIYNSVRTYGLGALVLLITPVVLLLVAGAVRIWHNHTAQARRSAQVVPLPPQPGDKKNPPKPPATPASVLTAANLSSAARQQSTSGLLAALQPHENIDDYLSDVGSVEEVLGGADDDSDSDGICDAGGVTSSSSSRKSSSEGTVSSIDEADLGEITESSDSEGANSDVDVDIDLDGDDAKSDSAKAGSDSSEFSIGGSLEGTRSVRVAKNKMIGAVKTQLSLQAAQAVAKARRDNAIAAEARLHADDAEREEEHHFALLDSLYADPPKHKNNDVDADADGGSDGSDGSMSSEEAKVLAHHYMDSTDHSIMHEHTQTSKDPRREGESRTESRYRRASAAVLARAATKAAAGAAEARKGGVSLERVREAALKPYVHEFVPKVTKIPPPQQQQQQGYDEHSDLLDSDEDGQAPLPDFIRAYDNHKKQAGHHRFISMSGLKQVAIAGAAGGGGGEEQQEEEEEQQQEEEEQQQEEEEQQQQGEQDMGCGAHFASPARFVQSSAGTATAADTSSMEQPQPHPSPLDLGALLTNHNHHPPPVVKKQKPKQQKQRPVGAMRPQRYSPHSAAATAAAAGVMSAYGIPSQANNAGNKPA